jgi:hypothetical protein
MERFDLRVQLHSHERITQALAPHGITLLQGVCRGSDWIVQVESTRQALLAFVATEPPWLMHWAHAVVLRAQTLADEQQQAGSE